ASTEGSLPCLPLGARTRHAAKLLAPTVVESAVNSPELHDGGAEGESAAERTETDSSSSPFPEQFLEHERDRTAAGIPQVFHPVQEAAFGQLQALVNGIENAPIRLMRHDVVEILHRDLALGTGLLEQRD